MTGSEASLDSRPQIEHRAKTRPLWSGGEQLFVTLRHRLDQMEYSEFLAKDSVDLVQRLLADLVQTTETARSFKALLETATNDRILAEEQVGPLRVEIGRLSSENNTLHRKLISHSDEADLNDRNTELNTRMLASQASDLRFLSTQYAHQVEVEKKRADTAQNKVENVFARIGMVHDQQPSTQQRAEKIFQRLQKIDIETGLEPLVNPPIYFRPPDPATADIMRLSNARIENLEKSNQIAVSRSTATERDIVLVREQLDKREREISRLGVELELARAQQFGANTDAKRKNADDVHMAGITTIESARDRIGQLELQIEYLQEHIDGLEKDILTLEADQGTIHAAILNDKHGIDLERRDAANRNKELLENVARLEKMFSDLNEIKPGAASKAAKENTTLKNIKKIGELTEKLKTSESKIEVNAKRINMFQKEVAQLKRDKEELKKAQTDANEPKKVQIEAQKKHLAGKPPIESVKKNLDENSSISVQNANINEDKEKWQLSNDELQKKKEELIQVQKEKTDMDQKCRQLMLEVKSTKSQIDILSMQLKVSVSTIANDRESARVLRADFENIKGDRDELISSLEDFEVQLVEVQSQITILTSERDNALQLYHQVSQKNSIMNSVSATNGGDVRLPVSSSINGDDSTQKNAQALEVTKLGAENLQLQSKIAGLVGEIANLQSDIQVMVQRQRETGSMANTALTDLEIQISGTKKESEEMGVRNSQLETQIVRVSRECADFREENESYARKLESAKIRISSIEIELDDNRLKIRELVAKAAQISAVNVKLLVAQGDSQKKLDERERQLGEQRELITHVDNERDGFQIDLDKKAELIVDHEDHIARLKKVAKMQEESVIQSREQIESLTQHLNSQDRETSSLLSQLQESQKQKLQFQQASKKYHDESESLGSDLAALTRENQILHSESNKVAAERDQYKSELRECDRQLEYLDQLIRSKDEEGQQLMHSYRKIISEREQIEVSINSSQEDLKNTRMELVMRDKRIQQLQLQIDQHAATLNKAKIDLNAYEKQCGNLTKSLATSDRALRHFETEKIRMNRDISSARELAHTLDRGKDVIHKQFISQSLENERLVKTLEKYESEVESTNAQYQSERLKCERLEHLIAVERTRKIQTEKSATEMTSSVNNKEAHLSQLIREQTETINMLNEKLQAAKKDREMYESRISHLEILISAQHQELDAAKRESLAFQVEKNALVGDLAVKEKVIQEVIQMKEPKMTELDQRIQEELDSTKKQLARYEERIERRQEEMSPRAAIDQRVLQTLAQLKDKERDEESKQ